MEADLKPDVVKNAKHGLLLDTNLNLRLGACLSSGLKRGRYFDVILENNISVGWIAPTVLS